MPPLGALGSPHLPQEPLESQPPSLGARGAAGLARIRIFPLPERGFGRSLLRASFQLESEDFAGSVNHGSAGGSQPSV